MKSNELRIGNWVIYHRNNLIDEYQKVLTVSEYAITVNEYNQDGACYPKDIAAFKPIPLTPEILEKAGFAKSNIDVWLTKGLPHFEIEECENNFIHSINEGEYWDGEPFQYLHQLQNLYFALNGEELQINL